MLPRTQPYQSASSGETHAGLFEDIGTRSLQTVRIGEGAGKIASGTNSVYIGYETGKAATTSSFCVYAGYQAGMLSTQSSFSTLIGAFAGRENRGSEVTFIGFRAGELNRDGSRLIAIGNFSMRENVSGTGSVAVGFAALERSLDGDYNTACGTQSLQDMRSGSFTTAMGHQSGRAAFQNNYGCYFGAYSGYSNSLGDGNCLFGFKSGYNLTSGSYNVGIGPFTLFDASDGSCNIAIGPFAGSSMTASTGSVIIGKNASANSTHGEFNVVIGTDSGLCNNGDNNVLLGARVASNSSLSSSVVIGVDAAPNIDGVGSVIIGTAIAKSIRNGSSNVLLGTGADGYRATVNSAIAIGTNKTFTSTNSISIGDDIVNERTSSILMGYGLTSDANNSVIMGNDINIQSVIYWKDPLNYSLIETVRADAITKLGVSNITYGVSNQILQSPLGEIYDNAVVGLITSNVYNSVTAPRSLRTSPASYDLRAAVSPSNYLIVQGRTYPIRTDTDATSNINIQNKVDTNMNDLFAALSNQIAVSLSNYVSSHSLAVPVSISPSLSNASAGTVVNILNFGGTSTHIPISFPKQAAVPHATFTTSNAIYTDPILSLSPSSLSITLPTVFTDPAVGVHNIPNSTLKYSVITPPKFGKLNAARFSNVDNIQYTPYVEAAFAATDSFEIRPVLEIVDSNQNIFGCPSSNDVTITIEMPTDPIIYTASNLTTVNKARTYLTSNILRTIPTPIPSSTPLRILSMTNNLNLVTATSGTYTSTVVSEMVTEQVHLYPDSQYFSYVQQIYAGASNVVSSNAQEFDDVFTPIFTTQIPDHTVSLSNYLAQTLSNLNNETLLYEPITENDQIIVDLMNVATLAPLVPPTYPSTDLELTYATYSNAFVNWVETYGTPSLSNQTDLYAIGECNTLFETTFIEAPRILYDREVITFASNLQLPVHGSSNLVSSNIIRNAVKDIQDFVLTYPVETASYSNYADLNAATQSAETILRKYYEIPRLFITYDDLLQQTNVGFDILDDDPNANFTVELSNAIPTSHTFNIHSVSDTLWSEYPSALPVSVIPRTKQLVASQTFSLSNASISNIYVDTYPQHGALATFSNYDLINPWMAEDKIRYIVQNFDGKTADTQWTLRYNNAIAYEPTLILPCPLPSSNLIDTYSNVSNVTSVIVSLSNIYTTTLSNINFDNTSSVSSLSNVVIIGSNQYDPSRGVLIATCNLVYSNVIDSITVYGEFETNIRSNVYTQISTLMFTELVDNGLTFSNTAPPQTLCNISSNVFVHNDPIFPLATSNIIIYETSNILYEYTRQEDTFIENIAYDVTHNMYFAAHDPSYYLYQQDSLILPRLPVDYETVTSNAYATGSNVLITTSNLLRHSNVHIYHPLFPLSRNIIYQSDPSFVYALSNGPYIDVVRSNVGPITSFTQQSLVDGDTWFRLKPQTATHSSHTISLSNASILVNLAPIATIQASSSLSSNIYLENNWQASNLGIWDQVPLLPFTPDKIHIESIEHGALHNGTQYSMTYLYTQRSNIHYVTTSNNYAEDTISFYFSSNSQLFSDIYRTTLNIRRAAYVTSQDINCGLRHASCNILNPHGFVYYTDSPTTKISVTSKQNVSLSKDLFTIDDVLASSIYVSVTDCSPTAPSAFFTYDVTFDDEVTIVYPSLTFDIRSYYHIAFPRASEEVGSRLRIQQLGTMPHVSNVLDGGLWNRVADLNTKDAGTVQPEDLKLIFDAPLQYGFLWNETTQQQTPTYVLLNDLQENRIHYVPYQSNVIPNEQALVRFVYENTASPEYTIDIKNYISRFPVIAIDTTVRSSLARQVNVPLLVPRSQGLISDGVSWTPSQPITLAQQTIAPLLSSNIATSLSNIYTSTLTLQSYTHSKPVAWSNVDPITISIDQADRWSLLPLASRVSQDELEERDIVMYVTESPSHGILLDITNGSNCNVSQFTDSQLLSNQIIYQHIGANTSNDSFRIALSSTPYDLASNELVINITPLSMPFVTLNTEMFIYHSNIESATVATHLISSNISVQGDGYLHILEADDDMTIPSVISLSNLADLGFQISSSYFDTHGTDAPFPSLDMRFAVNQTASNEYVNPLINIHPTYHDIFTMPFRSYLNRYVNSNVITTQQDALQVISYDIDRSLSASSNLEGRIVSYFLQVKPNQGAFDGFDASEGVQNQHTDFLRSYQFTLEFIGESDELICTVRFYRDIVEIDTIYLEELTTFIVPIPEQYIWDFNVWHNILFINQDPDNGNFTSLYIDYDQTSSRVQNAPRNIFAGQSISIPDMGTIEYIRVRTDMQSSSNYTGASNTIIQSPNTSVYGPNALGTLFELQNNRTQIQYRNQELYITTYSLEETQTGTVSSQESLNHNVVIGKEITVRGTNNICIGNRFVTSGRNSIILGNDIGSGFADAGTINDLYESIVIGNESFQSSIVRDVICIGNRNLNNLFESPVDHVNQFLSQRPILIGNDITQDRLDFNINIGNAFAKTIIGGEQIYVGLNNEIVGVGFASNAILSSNHALHVNGSIKANEITAPISRGFTKEIVRVVSHSNVIPQIHDLVALLDYQVLHDAELYHIVAPTAFSNVPNVFGVVEAVYEYPTYFMADVCIRGVTNVKVTGSVLNGDLLASSTVLRAAQATGSTQRHSYTLAKAMESTDPLGPAIQVIKCMCAV